MSDAPPPGRAGPAPAGDPAAAGRPLTADRVEAVLADFRGWLEALGGDRGGEPHGPSEPEPVDLHTLVAQFTALRHEVNLQTKAARAATEQAAEAAKRVAPPPAADPGEAARPLVKALVDVADALAASRRQVDRAQAEAVRVAAAARPGLLGRLARAAPPAADKLGPLLAGVADGYALSLRRVDRALADAGLEPVECAGKPFDPEAMEAVEAVAGDGVPTGTVVEEVRRGYRRAGKVFRPALVKVAR